MNWDLSKDVLPAQVCARCPLGCEPWHLVCGVLCQAVVCAPDFPSSLPSPLQFPLFLPGLDGLPRRNYMYNLLGQEFVTTT
jgi:hypothetical protein